MKLFDRYESLLYATENRVYGSAAVWVSADEQVSFSGPVLFNDPTIKELVDGADFIVQTPWMEYYVSSFPGLKNRADSGITEIVTIDGVGYYVREVNRTADGNNYKAMLELVSNDHGPQ